MELEESNWYELIWLCENLGSYSLWVQSLSCVPGELSWRPLSKGILHLEWLQDAWMKWEYRHMDLQESLSHQMHSPAPSDNQVIPLCSSVYKNPFYSSSDYWTLLMGLRFLCRTTAQNNGQVWYPPLCRGFPLHPCVTAVGSVTLCYRWRRCYWS